MNQREFTESDDWLSVARHQPVAFSQVREDALVDLDILHRYKNPRVLMVASGGCTLAAIVGARAASHIVAVDINPSQLALCKCKVALLSKPPQDRLMLLGHIEIDPEIRLHRIRELFGQINLPQDTLGEINRLAEVGLDHSGRYEAVFGALRGELQSHINECTELCSEESILRQHLSTELRHDLCRAFDVVMTQDNLTLLFGGNATANRVTAFSKHFFYQFEYAISNFQNSTNPYLSQLLLGRFATQTLYPWLSVAVLESTVKVEYICGTMEEALSKTAPNSFDFIHLSNTLDWVAPESAVNVLALTHRSLKRGGATILRQLNSNLDIRHIPSEIWWNEKLSTELYCKDRSFFYRSLHIGFKK